MPEITVVIPCFNYGRFLDEAVASVLAQCRPPKSGARRPEGGL